MTTTTEQTARADELHTGDTLVGYLRSDRGGRHDTGPAGVTAVDTDLLTTMVTLDRTVSTPRGCQASTLVLFRDTTVYRATS
jgi:hypothetical protein